MNSITSVPPVPEAANQGLRKFLIAFSAALLCNSLQTVSAQTQLIPNWNLQPTNDLQAPAGFTINGDCWYRQLDDFGERSGWAVRLFSNADIDQNGRFSGSVSTTVSGLSPTDGRWFRFRIQAMAEDGFAVKQDDLILQVEFFRDGGSNALDSISSRIYPQIIQERQDLLDNGTNQSLSNATWRSYELDFRTPFPEIDTLKLTVRVAQGAGSGDNSEFMINEFSLTPISGGTSQPTTTPTSQEQRPDLAIDSLISLGGRWYAVPDADTGMPPREFHWENADRLIYLADRPVAPFAGNMTGWLRKGFLDRNGQLVERDQLVEDNLVIHVTDQQLLVQSKNLPNHPVAVFPDRWRTLDGNPNYIREQQNTWQIPLQPKQAAQPLAMQGGTNNNGALPMGPIGFAVNGVVFFNPFDHLLNEDAIWRLDRCCGHPSPNSMYHYHKYPVCVKSPWSDDGESHSPVIGFAFDGFPVYGPYETRGELAKDSRTNPLNDFNVHFDEQRGWHYHVTPGQFPHIIGGYWGEAEHRGPRGPRGNRPGPPPGRRPPPRQSGRN